jgi:hypothetical protein
MKIIIKLLIFLICLQTISISASTETKISQRITPIETTIFVNGRVNPVWLTITDNKNKTFQININAGGKHTLNHKPQEIKKVVCSERFATNVTLSQTDLNNYAVFVFNVDQKTDKYNFINIEQKSAALKKARETGSESIFNEISELTIYNP